MHPVPVTNEDFTPAASVERLERLLAEQPLTLSVHRNEIMLALKHLRAAAGLDPGSTCPRCEGTGRYQRFPGTPVATCAVCNGKGVVTDLPAAVGELD